MKEIKLLEHNKILVEDIERAMVNSMARSCVNVQQVNLDDKAVK